MITITKNKMKYIPNIIITFGLIILIILIVGCKCASGTTPINPDQRFYELLHIGENLAYKSVTEKDYKDNDDEC